VGKVSASQPVPRTPHTRDLQVKEAALERSSVDELNAALLKQNRDRQIADVLTGMEESHAQLLAALAKISNDDLRQPIRAIGPKERPLNL
jgi:hypothetical protein